MAFFFLLLAIFNCQLSSVSCQEVNPKLSPGRNQDNFYFYLYSGLNKSANEDLPWYESSIHPLSGGAVLGIGHEWNPLWGWRAAARINHNKGRNVPYCESHSPFGWNNVGGFGDITFDIYDAFRLSSKKMPSNLNVKLFTGGGMVKTFAFDSVPLSYTYPYSHRSRILPAFRGGILVSYRLSHRWLLAMEYCQSIYNDYFNGVKGDKQLDGRANFNIGVVCMVGAKPKEKAVVQRRIKLKVCPDLPLETPLSEPVKARRISGRAFLDFPVNGTAVIEDYRNNHSELRRIYASVDSAKFDESVKITQITLHGYASPESPYSNNARLAMQRTESLMRFLIGKYQFAESLFNNQYTPEDWDNLRGFLNNIQGRRVKGDYWYDNKDYVETPIPPATVQRYSAELLAIIDLAIDADEKEELLKRVGGGEPYRWLLEYVYPGLRHTDYVIDYEVVPFSVEKCKKLIYTHPEALSLSEIYSVAVSYEVGSDNWTDALLIAARQFPESQTANYNAACACATTRRLMDARKYLAKAGSGAHVQYLSDVISAMEGAVKWHIENGKVVVDI